MKGFDAEARKQLLAYAWGGNVRELKRVVRMAVLHTEGDTVMADTLEFDEMPMADDASLALNDMEKKQIIHALEQAKGNRKLAAALARHRAHHAVQQDESIRDRIENSKKMKGITGKRLPFDKVSGVSA